MATTRSFLLIPVTLCFLLVLAAAEQQGKAMLIIDDKVRCKSNLSRIVSNAPVHLVINNATVPGGTGRTTSDGQLLMTVNLNTEQLAALMSNGSSKAYVIVPPDSCGVPKLRPGTQMGAQVKPTAMVTISGDDGTAGSSVQRPAVVAASDTTPLPVRFVNGGSLRATNNGDAAHLVGLLHICYAKLECALCIY